MIVFSLICALLVVVALAFILAPLRHPDRIATATTTTEATVAVYRHQLAEMESDRRDQIITNDQFLRDRDELEQRLIADLPKDAYPIGREKGSDGSATLVYALAVALPAMAILLYLMLGSPASLLPSP